MFNQDESRKLWKYTRYGAATGAVLCVVLFVYELFAEAWNCLCDCFGGCDSLPEVNSWLTFLFVFLISLCIGFMVGICSASSDRSARLEKEEQERQKNNRIQREKYAADIKKKVQTALQSVYTVQSKAKDIKEDPPLVSVQKQQAGWEALSNAQNENEEVKNIIKDLQSSKEEQ